jgi:Xaa-Pro aminopeptidase
LRQLLGQNRLDLLLVTHLPNVRYLCGFTGSSAALLVNENSAVLFTDGRYTTQAREEVEGAKVIIGSKAPVVGAAEWLNAQRSRGRKAIGIEPEHMTVAVRTKLAAALDRRFRLQPAPPLVERLRMVKEAREIQRIRVAVHLGASLFDIALKTIRPGTRETDVAAAMEFAARCGGASEMSFPTIIAAGERSALPHGRASGHRIPRRGFVVCDFGVILAGYCSDMTRTVWVGRAPADAGSVYDAVLESQLAGVAAVRPGATAGEIDAACRNILKKRGLAKFFSHSTGHGVGIEIHESPRLAAAQKEPLQPGMVVTIEPGVYLPGKWGVRIEDMVLVTEQGCEVLTPTSKEFIAIEPS